MEIRIETTKGKHTQTTRMRKGWSEWLSQRVFHELTKHKMPQAVFTEKNLEARQEELLLFLPDLFFFSGLK